MTHHAQWAGVNQKRRLRGGPRDGATVDWGGEDTVVYRDEWSMPGDEWHGVMDIYRVSNCGMFYDHVEVIHVDQLERCPPEDAT